MEEYPSKEKKKPLKTMTGFRIDPTIKKLAVVAATQENRSFSNYLENLIRQDLAKRTLADF
jgi:predicted HicB family RNase H-like nuclease